MRSNNKKLKDPIVSHKSSKKNNINEKFAISAIELGLNSSAVFFEMLSSNKAYGRWEASLIFEFCANFLDLLAEKNSRFSFFFQVGCFFLAAVRLKHKETSSLIREYYSIYDLARNGKDRQILNDLENKILALPGYEKRGNFFIWRFRKWTEQSGC